MDKIVDNEFVTVWVYPDKKIVRHEFHKFIYGETFRDALTKGAEAFEKHHCVKWLSDDRNNSALLPEDTEWGGNLGASYYESWLEVLGFNIARKGRGPNEYESPDKSLQRLRCACSGLQRSNSSLQLA